MKLKSRIINHINTIELIVKEIKKYNLETSKLEEDIIKADSSDDKLNLYRDIFAKSNIVSLLSMDLDKYISKLIECYTCAILYNEKDFSEEEENIINNYIRDYSPMFILDKNNIVSKDPNLFDLINNSVQKLNDITLVNNVIEQIREVRNNINNK